VTKQPLDPASLGALNPHTAVARLQQLSHDELVDFFARAKPEDVGEIFEIFTEVGLAKIVAVLGDINRRKATELIRAVGEDDCIALLGNLPEAAEAIAREAARLGWADAEPIESFLEGYARRYNNGHVFWSQLSGVTRTTPPIDSYWTESAADWGFPLENQTALTSPHASTGVRQRFQSRTVYSSSSARGAFYLTDALCYEDEEGSRGWLGFPMSERQRNGQFGTRQMFEGGAIYSFVVEGPEGLRSFAVRREALSVLDDQTFRPISKETSVASSSGAEGTIQHFEFILKHGY